LNEYELLYVISPRLTADEVDATVERVGALIEGSGGSISMVDHWGRRRLAYPIRQHFEGVYVLTHCMLDGLRAQEIERALNLNENVLRHLMVRGIIPGYNGAPDQEVVETRRQAPAVPAAVAPAPADGAPADGAANEAAADGEPAADGEAAPDAAPAAAAAEPETEASTAVEAVAAAEPEADPSAPAEAPAADADAEAEALASAASAAAE